MVSSAPDGVQGHQLAVAHSSSRPSSFRVEIDRNAHTIFVGPVGELDLATADQLDRALRHVVDGGCGDLVLDLRGLSFIDSSGLHLVIKWEAFTQERAIKFAIVQGGPNVHRVFEIMDLLDRLPFVGPGSRH